jgi:hypothetical protein
VRRAILNQVIDRSRRAGTWRRVRHLAWRRRRSTRRRGDRRAARPARARPRAAAEAGRVHRAAVLRGPHGRRHRERARHQLGRASSDTSATAAHGSPPRSIRTARVRRAREARMSAPDPAGLARTSSELRMLRRRTGSTSTRCSPRADHGVEHGARPSSPAPGRWPPCSWSAAWCSGCSARAAAAEPPRRTPRSRRSRPSPRRAPPRARPAGPPRMRPGSGSPHPRR